MMTTAAISSRDEQMKWKQALRKLRDLLPLNAAHIERGTKAMDRSGEGVSNVTVLDFLDDDEKTLTPEKFSLLRKWALDTIKSILGDMELKRIVLNAEPDFRAQILTLGPFSPSPVFLDSSCPKCGKLTPGLSQEAQCCIHCGTALN